MKTYAEVISWMFSQLPMYQHKGISAYREDLHNTNLLMQHLNFPHKDLKCIHIGGTNGKGSTSSLLASVLQEAGYKVGLYTSPHLKDYRERIKINGIEISESFVVNFINKHQSFFEKHQLSFFEMTVGLAFDYFNQEQVDFAIIEVGLGGRLDATNVITPILSIITNIGWDHMNILGESLEKIAFEKAGIIKKNVPVVIGEYLSNTKSIFEEKANSLKSKIYFAQDEVGETPPTVLMGDYQEKNKKSVIKAIEVLNDLGFNISKNYIENGFLNIVKNTALKGRWQVLNQSPKVITDIAHNYDGLKIVLNQILNVKCNNQHFVLGFSNDKDLSKILPLFPKQANYYFSKPDVPRGLEGSILQIEGFKYGLNGKSYKSIHEAYKEALYHALPNDLIYIGGSAFVVAEVI